VMLWMVAQQVLVQVAAVTQLVVALQLAAHTPVVVLPT